MSRRRESGKTVATSLSGRDHPESATIRAHVTWQVIAPREFRKRNCRIVEST
jgi:hypothetical protein